HFTLGIDIQQAIHVGIDETTHDAGSQTQGGGDGEKVGEESTVVPTEVAVSARLIFPGVAPVSAGANDSEWRVCDRRFSAGGFKERAPIISGAQPAQAELSGGKVVDAGLQVAQVAANQIQLDFVQRSSAGRRAKVEFTPGIAPLSRNAAGEIEQLGYSFQIRSSAGEGGDTFGNGRECGDAGLVHLGGQAHGLERGINLKRQRLVGPVHEMRVGADAGVRMFGCVVISPGGFGVAVFSHGTGGPSSRSKGSISGCVVVTLEDGSASSF